MNATLYTCCPRCGGVLKPHQDSWLETFFYKVIALAITLLSGLVLYVVASALSLPWLNKRVIVIVGFACGLLALVLFTWQSSKWSCSACGWKGYLTKHEPLPAAYEIGKRIGRLFRKNQR